MKMAVIGAGNVGGTLGQRWVQAGHDVVFRVRELIADIGFAPCRVGRLESARNLKPLAVMWISEFRLRRPGSDFACRLIDRHGHPAA